MIDLTSDDEVENDYPQHTLDKENADANRKHPFSTFCGGVSMMPDLDSKMSPKEQQEHHKNIGLSGGGVTRYAALKKANPFFLYQDVVDVILQCDELKTIQFCQKMGLIAKQQVCENCGTIIGNPWFERSRNQWWWVCNKKPKGKPKCNNFKFSIKKGTFFDNTRLGIYQVLLLVWHFVRNMSIKQTQSFMDIGGHNNNTVVD